MIRASKKVFRYAFPIIFGTVLVSFFMRNSSSIDAKQPLEHLHQSPETKIESGVAKQLTLNSYNTKDNSRLLVQASQAKQHKNKVDLINPKSCLEKDKSSSTLTANKAEYYESDGIVNFIQEVNFLHTSGLSAQSPDAVLTTETQNISGTNGIAASHKQSQITGNTYLIESKKGKLSVQGNACLNVCSSGLKAPR
jgi:hypothetical protein